MSHSYKTLLNFTSELSAVRLAIHIAVVSQMFSDISYKTKVKQMFSVYITYAVYTVHEKKNTNLI